MDKNKKPLKAAKKIEEKSKPSSKSNKNDPDKAKK
jgi:hypothetical protein